MKLDIKDRADIELLVGHFYKKLSAEPTMTHFFAHVDWSHHLPKMIGFWEFILFSTPNAYTGSMMEPHFAVHRDHPMKAENFQTWLSIFYSAVDELFEGPKADDAKNAAQSIGATLKYKILGNTTKSNFTITRLPD